MDTLFPFDLNGIDLWIDFRFDVFGDGLRNIPYGFPGNTLPTTVPSSFIPK